MTNTQDLLIKPSVIKRMVKASGKRTSKEFLDALNTHVLGKVEMAITTHNGGKKTIDREVAVYIGLK